MLPLAIQYGMTPEQFWHEDTELFVAYYKAYRRKVDETVYLQGYYTYLGMSLALGNAFSKRNHFEFPKFVDRFAEDFEFSKEEVREKQRSLLHQQVGWLNDISTN